jgi:hypothetical protein
MPRWLKRRIHRLFHWRRGRRNDFVPHITPLRRTITPTKGDATTPTPLPIEDLLWVERTLQKLNQKLIGANYPECMPDFLQRIPRSLLTDGFIPPDVIVEAATELVRETSKRIGRWGIPFRKPRVEFTPFLLDGEPGHIDFSITRQS